MTDPRASPLLTAADTAVLAAPRLERLLGMLVDDGVDLSSARQLLYRELGASHGPTSSVQRRLWFLERLAPQDGAYHVPLVIRLTGELDVSTLESALAAVVARHEILRTTLVEQLGVPVQVVHAAAVAALPITPINTKLDPCDAYIAAALALMKEPFDLNEAPPWRVALFRASPHDHCLAFVLHHVLVDGMSLGILLGDLAEAYCRASTDGRDRPSLPLQYIEFAAWQQAREAAGVLEGDIAYWTRQLADAPDSYDLGGDTAATQCLAVPDGVIHCTLDGQVSERLAAIAAAEGVSTFAVGLAAWAAWLHKRTGADDLVIAAPSAGRTRCEFEAMIGPVVNTLALRLSVGRSASFRDLVRLAAAVTKEARAHEHAPIERVIQQLRPARTALRAPIARVAFARERDVVLPNIPGLRLTQLRIDHAAAKADLALTLARNSEGWHLALEYSGALFTAAGAKQALEDFTRLAESVSASPDATPIAPRHAAETRSSTLPLTPVQTRVWLDQQRTPDIPLYNVAVTVAMAGIIDPAAFSRAFSRLVAGTDALRLSFVTQGGAPRQQIAADVAADVTMVDLSRLSEDEQTEWLTDHARQSFDLEGPLFRSMLVRYAHDSWLWLLVQHHLVTDGWSIRVLLERMSALYDEELSGTPAQLPSASFADYARQAHQTANDDAWWASRFQDIEPPRFFGSRVVKTSTRVSRSRIEFDPDLKAAFRDAATRTHRASPAQGAFLVCGAALVALLHRMTGQERIAIGVPFHNRRSDDRHRVGLLMNVVPVAVTCRGDDTFAVLCDRLKAELSATVRHARSLPPAHVREKACDVLLNVQATAIDRVCGAPTRLDWIHTGHEHESVAVEFHDVADGRLGFDVRTHDDVFDPDARRRFGEHLLRMTGACVADPHARVGEVALLSLDEHDRTRVASIGPHRPEAYGTPAIERILATAQACPDAAAIVTSSGTLTYKDLDRRVRSIAQGLIRYGVTREELVGVRMGRSADFVSAVLGALAAGGAYLPLDPQWPQARLAQCLADAAPRLIVTAPGEATGAADVEVDALLAESPLNPAARRDGGDLAYVIYTSGSTDRPKGVEIVERSLANYLAYAAAMFELSPADRVLQFASLTFDTAVEEIFPTLAAGATLVLRDDEMIATPDGFLARLAEMNISVLNLPTAYWHVLAEHSAPLPRCVRLVLIGGEAVRADLLARWRSVNPAVRLFNGYGPTEATVVTTFADLTAGEASDPVSIGLPIWNAEAYVLEPSGAIAPDDHAGELYIGGVGLARGYRNAPELTRSRFVTHPLGHGRPLYRTGDLVRRRPSGALEFLRRVDDQVKIRGYRVEPGEIETQFRSHPAVADVAVIVSNPESDAVSLAACVTARAGHLLTAAELRAHLRTALPEYMIPTELYECRSLPRLTSGKIDRTRLTEGAVRLADGAVAVPPRTAVERRVAEIWAEVLPEARSGIYDNFFDSGGHSLGAAPLAARLSEVFGITLPLRTVFEQPTIAGLAAAVESLLAERARAGGTAAPDEPDAAADSSRADPPQSAPEPAIAIPASDIQRQLWIAADADPTRVAYSVCRTIEVSGRVDMRAFEQAVDLVVDRHAALRTAFAWIDGTLVQTISNAHRPGIEITPLPDAQGGDVASAIQREAERPFDLTAGFACRWHVFRLDTRDVICLTLHHIICDGWSLAVLGRDLTAAYEAFAAGHRPHLALPRLSYADALRRPLTGDVSDEESIAFWRRALAGAPAVLALPVDRARPSQPSGRGGRVSVVLPSGAAASVARLARDEQTTPFVVFLSAYAMFLHRWTGAIDIPIGTPVSRRDAPELQDVVGLFVNTVVARFQGDGRRTARTVIANGRALLLDALRHRAAPFGRVLEAVQPPRVPGVSPIFQTMFAMQTADREDGHTRRQSWTPTDVYTKTAKYDLTAFVYERNGAFEIVFEFNHDIFDTATMEAAVRAFATLIDSALADPEAPLDAAPWLRPAERRSVLAAGEGMTRRYPAWSSLHELFAQVADRSPDAIAYEDSTGRVSYGHLRARSRAVARALRDAGVRAGDRVAILVPRGAPFVVAMLGVVEAAAAYVPIDPTYPHARVRFMLDDADVRAVVVAGEVPIDLEGTPAVDVRTLSPCSESGDMPSHGGGDAPAYVMYTSGSTGTPKGVVVPNRAIARLVLDTDYCSIAAADRLAQASNTSFDAATFEIWGALLNGATLVAVPADVVASPHLLREHLRQHRISLMFVTTSVLNRAAAEVPDAFAPLRTLLFGGEAANPAAVRRVLEAGPPESLIHVYGPTESTTFATAQRVTAVDDHVSTVPIGRPIANTSAYVLDERMEPVPPGVVGELFIGGDGLALGYHRRPELTSARFIPDPHHEGRRLYRTGDRCRMTAGGAIEFVGRRDRQVKVRGFRIEPAEIERVLAAHPAVTGSIAGVPDSATDLVALVTVSDPQVDAEMLRQHLSSRLPSFSVPSRIAVVDTLPVTAHGKLDRTILDTATVHDLRRHSRAPQDPLEAELVEIWEDLLQVSPIGCQDDFFELGGNSLLAATMIDRVAALFGRRVPLSTLMRNATVEALATAYWEAERSRGSALHPVREEGERPPLFFVHGDFNGGGLYCGRLARHLAPSQPFYTLAPIALDTDTPPSSIDEMADEYAELIARARPSGPIALGGYCHGGLVAFELARRLARHRPVTSVLLVHPSPIEPRLLTIYWLVRAVARLRKRDHAAHMRNMIRIVTALQFLGRASAREIAAWAWRKVVRVLRGSAPRSPLVPAGIRTVRHDPAMWQATVDAVITYVPRGYDGAVSLFVPLSSAVEGGRRWSRFVRRLSIVPVPGDHRTCVTTYADTLGEALEAQLRQSATPAGDDDRRRTPGGRRRRP